MYLLYYETMIKEATANVETGISVGGCMEIVKNTKVMCISRKGNNKLKIYVDGQ